MKLLQRSVGKSMLLEFLNWKTTQQLELRVVNLQVNAMLDELFLMLLLAVQFLDDQPLEMDHSPPRGGADQLGMLIS
jgi:hypothetical protein